MSSSQNSSVSITTQSSLARWQQARREAAASVAEKSEEKEASLPLHSTLLKRQHTQQPDLGEEEDDKASDAARAPSHEVSFDFSNRPSERVNGSLCQPRARDLSSSTALQSGNTTAAAVIAIASHSDENRLKADPSPVPSSSGSSAPAAADQQQRRPPVDAERIGSLWSARYTAERTPYAAPHVVSDHASKNSPAANTSLQRLGRTKAEGTGQKEEVQTDEMVDLLAAFRAKEKEALDARRALLEAEARHKKEKEALQKSLASESEARQQAERDVDELLAAHSLTTATTPHSFTLHQNGNSKTNGAHAANGESTRLSTVSGVNATAASDAFWQKMKEREERARAKVRKEFIQESQQRLYAEQDKRAEAEKVAKEAERRLKVAEGRIADHVAAVNGKQAEVDALKATLSEKEVRISELESEVALRTHQLGLRDADKEKDREQLRKQCADLKDLLQRRDDALEEQRDFTQNLLKELGLKDKDLLDRESINEGVHREIANMQEKYKLQQDALEAEGRDRELKLKQELDHQQTVLEALKAKCEDYRNRAGVAEAELAKHSGQLSIHTKENESQLQRLQGKLIDLGVEKRSLELQLERVSEAAGRYAKDYAATKEGERHSREALVRRYSAEVTTLQEEVDRLSLQRKRDQERNLQEVLQLGQELTSLKEQNARYTHLLKVLEHDKSQSAFLLNQAKERNDYLRLQDRRRDSISFGDDGDRSRGSLSKDREMQTTTAGAAVPSRVPRSSAASTSAVVDDRRVAELEATRAALTEKLTAASARIRYLEQQQQRQQQQLTSLSVSSGYGNRNGNSSDEILSRRLLQERDEFKARQAELLEEVRRLREEQQNDTNRQQQQVVVATDLSSAPANTTSIYASLANMVRLLEENAAVMQSPNANRHRRDSPPVVGEKGDYYFKPSEREVLQSVLASCLAALDCLQGNRSGSPYYSEGEGSFFQRDQRQKYYHHHHRRQESHKNTTALTNHDANSPEQQQQQQQKLSLEENVPPPLPVAATAPAVERTELASEPCWDDVDDNDEGNDANDRPFRHVGGNAYVHRTAKDLEGNGEGAAEEEMEEEDELFVPHPVSGILRYSPIAASLPQSSVPSPSPASKYDRQEATSRAEEQALFQNIHLLSGGRDRGLVASQSSLAPSTSASPAVNRKHDSAVGQPSRSTPPPPASLSKRQSV